MHQALLLKYRYIDTVIALAVIVGTQLWLQLLLQAPPVQMHNSTATYFTSWCTEYTNGFNCYHSNKQSLCASVPSSAG